MGAGCVCVYVCILWCFLLCVHVCESVCALASLSHMCGACAVSAGLGEEELGDSRAQRRLRQAGRQQAGGLPGRLGPQPKAAQVGGWGGSGVFGPGLYMLPQCPCVQPCAPTHPCKLGPLFYSNSYHSPSPGHSQVLPHVVLLEV